MAIPTTLPPLHNRFILLRHGEKEKRSLYPGKSPSNIQDALTFFELTSVGRTQIVKSVTRAKEQGLLSGSTKIHASFLRRTKESAEEAARVLGIPIGQVVLSPKLQERDLTPGEISEDP